jgi:hypothetical protein
MLRRLVWEHTSRWKSGAASILSIMSTAKCVRATWSLGFSASIIWILYALRRSLLCRSSCTVERVIVRNGKLAARIDLHGLRWNTSLMRVTYSSEVRVFPEDFTRNTLPVVLRLLSQDPTIFRLRSWRPSGLRSNTTLDKRKARRPNAIFSCATLWSADHLLREHSATERSVDGDERPHAIEQLL